MEVCWCVQRPASFRLAYQVNNSIGPAKQTPSKESFLAIALQIETACEQLEFQGFKSKPNSHLKENQLDRACRLVVCFSSCLRSLQQLSPRFFQSPRIRWLHSLLSTGEAPVEKSRSKCCLLNFSTSRQTDLV